MHKGPPAPIIVITSHHPVAKSCHSCSIMNLPFIWTCLSAISLLMPASGFVRPLRHSGRYTSCDENLAGTFRENGLFSSESDDLNNIAHKQRSKENDIFGTREAQKRSFPKSAYHLAKDEENLRYNFHFIHRSHTGTILPDCSPGGAKSLCKA